MLRFVYLSTELDDRGGAERVVMRLLKGLNRAEFEPSAFLIYRQGALGEMLHKQGVTTVALNLRRRYDLPRAYLAAKRYFSENPVDVVMTSENRLASLLTYLLRRRAIIPHYLVRLQNTRLPRGVQALLFTRILQLADRVIALSERNRVFWSRAYPQLAPSKFIVIPNGIHLERYHPLDPETQRTYRLAKGLPQQQFLVGLVTFFKDFKNLTGFVQVAQKVIQAGVDAHFVLVGAGPQQDELNRALSEYQMTSFFTLPGKTHDSAEWYPLFDVALMTSSCCEGFPNTLVEAMGCGLPIVATDVAGIPDIVVHGETGFLSPPTEVETLAQYVIRLAQDTALRQRMGSAGRQRALAEFDVQKMIERYAELLRSLC